jgi:hypothetical protein
MKTILSLILLCLSLNLSSQTVYIDPTFTGIGTGSQVAPLKDLPTLESNKTYLLKSGSTLEATRKYIYNVTNTKISTYGNGKATIHFGRQFTSRLLNIKGDNNLIENLNVVSAIMDSTPKGEGDPLACVLIETWGKDNTIKNCNVKGGFRGIVGGNYNNKVGTLSIINCTVDSVQHDGIYVSYLDSLYVKCCKVTNCNLGWAQTYGGDCLQGGDLRTMYVDSCNFDHTTTKGKYCLISTKTINITVKNTTLTSYDGEACIYPSCTNFVSENTIFKGGLRCIQNRAGKSTIKNCLLVGNKVNIFAIDASGDKLQIDNCTFVDFNNDLISGYGNVGVLKAFISNCNFYNCAKSILGNAGNVDGINNNFYPKAVKSYNTLQAPTFVEPVFEDNILYNSNLNGIGSYFKPSEIILTETQFDELNNWIASLRERVSDLTAKNELLNKGNVDLKNTISIHLEYINSLNSQVKETGVLIQSLKDQVYSQVQIIKSNELLMQQCKDLFDEGTKLSFKLAN